MPYLLPNWPFSPKISIGLALALALATGLSAPAVQSGLAIQYSIYLFRQADSAEKRGDFAESEKLWRQDLDLMSKQPGFEFGDIEYWCSETRLAQVVEKQGRFSEAKALCLDALARAKANNTPGYKRIVPLTMTVLATFYYKNGHKEEAYQLVDQAEQLKN